MVKPSDLPCEQCSPSLTAGSETLLPFNSLNLKMNNMIEFVSS